MALGSPKTNKVMIGTFELRIGPLNLAAKLTEAHSVGIIDQVKIDVQMDSADLLAGFPQKPADTAITKQVTGITATLRENTSRNLDILLGNGIGNFETDPADVRGEVSTSSSISSSASTITIQNASGSIVEGGHLVIYSKDNPGNVQFVRVSTVSGSTVTLDSTLKIHEGFASGERVRFYQPTLVAGGGTSPKPKYFTATLLRTDRGTGRPVGFHFWKTTIAAGISLGATVSDFGSFEMQLKALEPAAMDYEGVGTSLHHVATEIQNNPVFTLFDVSDSATANI